MDIPTTRSVVEGLGLEVQGVCDLRFSGTHCQERSGKRHCTEKLRSVCFNPVLEWESTSTHHELQSVFSVYVDNFQMARPVANMNKAWAMICSVISMDEPMPLGKYSGCGL